MLHVQKTTATKTVVTMDIVAFYAKETVLFCPHDKKNFFSDQLRSLVPRGGTFGFDVIVEVGLALFVHCRNNIKIMMALAAENVFISEREVSYLGRKFINYLALAHRQSQPGLRYLMTRRGGYILHVDGTCEGDSPNLFCGLDEISELVLDTIKIPSEKKEQLVPFFQRIKDQYGEPKALVHDMGRGIIAAVEEVFPGVADFICHFHFLRDLGKDLMLDEYTTLQKHLRKFKVRPLLRQRAKYLEQKINPACQSIDEIIVSIKSGSWQTSSFENIPLITTYALIQWIFEYPRQSSGYGFPFDRPHLDFYRYLQNAHLDKYLEKLFADPLPVSTSEGFVYIQPQRTNNILERFFRREKRRGRKKSGTASMSKLLKSLLADTPLVQNLKNTEYMEIILNGCKSLAERFSKIDAHMVQLEMKAANNDSEKILPAIKKLIRDSDLTKKISSLFLSAAK